MRTRINIVSVLAAIGLLAALPGTAGAPKIFGLPNASGGCSEEGVGEGSYIGGSLTVDSFDVKEDVLVANVLLVATCKINDEFRSQTEAVGTASASVLESSADRFVLALVGTAGGKQTTFTVDTDLEVEAEKSATSIVKKVARDPDMSAADLAAALNKYLGKK